MSADNLRFGVVVSRFNSLITDKLLEGALDILRRHGVREDNIVVAIKKASPNLLLAGTGVRKKEKWLYNHRQQLNTGLFLWCGECFDIFCGKREKPSRTLWSSGFEFIPRFFRNPFRILYIPLFLYYLLLLLIYRMLKL